TPSTTHREVATDLLSREVDLLVEKPLALDAENAWAIVDAAEEHDRVLGVGHIFRHHPALCELKRRIDRGELGDLKYLNTSRFSFRVPRRTTGALHSLAVHDVDVFGWLVGHRPAQVYCRLDRIVREGIDETATLLLEYDGDGGGDHVAPSGVTGVINSSWQVPTFGKSRHLSVVGSERAAYLDYLEPSKLELYDARIVTERDGTLRARDEGHSVHEVENYEPLKREVEDFLTAVDERGRPRADGRV
ncbi:Gfo/Idh/MocA family protein, partial [Halobium palmae]